MIKNKINNKKYIGQTTMKRVEDRWKVHINSLQKNSLNNVYLQRSWNKYGKDAFEFKLLTKVNSETNENLIKTLDKIERKCIKKLKTKYNEWGYNIRDGGNNGKLSEETKQKISESVSGKNHPMYEKKQSEETKLKRVKTLKSDKNTWRGLKHSEQTKKKMSIKQSGENNGFYGKHHTEETKELLKILSTGRFCTIETRKKMSKSRTGEKNPFYGKHHTEGTKNKISEKLKNSMKGEANPFYGKKHSEEVKNKIKETKKQNYLINFRKEKGYLVIKTYNMLQDGESNINIIRELNISKGFLYNVKNKLGYHGEIINEYLSGDFKI